MKFSDFAKQMKDVHDPQRDQLALKAMLDGYMPSFLRNLVVCATEAVIDNVYYRMEYRVPPQGASIGEDEDFGLWPLTEPSAQAFCDAKMLTSSSDGSRVTEYFIPPRKIVKATWEQSTCKIVPQPISRVTASNPSGHPGAGTEPIVTEQAMINAAMKDAGCPLTAFSVTKKCYITRPNLSGAQMAFGGWFYPGGSGPGGKGYLLGVDPGWRPERRVSGSTYGSQIQPWDSSFHEAGYEDYSHELLLVYYSVTVNGESYTFDEICSHPKLWPLASDEGPFNPRFPNAGPNGKPLLNKTSRMPGGAAPTPPAHVGQIARYVSNAAGVVQMQATGSSVPPPGSMTAAVQPSGLWQKIRNPAIAVALGTAFVVGARALSR